MKAHTQDYKNNLKGIKEVDSIITIGDTELTSDQINSANLHYEGNILKSVMKQLDLVLTEPLEVGTELNYKLGVKAEEDDNFEYMDYGQFIVKEIEKQEDTNTYKLTCYDKMLYAMKDYEKIIDINLFNEDVEQGAISANSGQTYTQCKTSSTTRIRVKDLIPLDVNKEYTISIGNEDYNYVIQGFNSEGKLYDIGQGNWKTTSSTITNVPYIALAFKRNDNEDIQVSEISDIGTKVEETINVYPITIKNYLKAICDKLGLTLKDNSFANQDNEIQNELYLDSDGNSLGYTFRDVLDEIAQATGSTICINAYDELEVRYIDDATNETQSIEGTDIELTDSEEAPLQGIEVLGNTTQETQTGNKGTTITEKSIYLTNVDTSKDNYITLKGDTYQNGTPTPEAPIEIQNLTGDNVVNICSKNLLPNNVVSQTLNSLTITKNSDDSITINGTPNATTELRINTNNFTLQAGTYYISTNKSGTFGNNAYINIRDVAADTNIATVNLKNASSGSFTLTEAKEIYVRFYVSSGVSLTNVKIYPMLEKGSTASTYAPYTGNSYEVNLGKNLYNPSYRTSSSNIYVVNGTATESNGVFILTATGTDMYMWQVKSTGSAYNKNEGGQLFDFVGDEYTISITNQTMKANYITFYDENKISLGYIGFGNANVKTIKRSDSNVPSNAKYFTIRVGYNQATSGTSYSFSVQLEKGSSATDYAKYFEPIELNKINTYQDYFFTDGSKWYLHKEVGKVILNGSENWATRTGGTTYAYSVSGFFGANKSSAITDSFAFITGGATSTQNVECLASANTTKSLSLFTNNSSLDTVANLKTWLSSHNVLMYYNLATPTNTEITNTELITQLNNLYRATIYNPLNINTDTENLLPYINLNYNVVRQIPSPEYPSEVECTTRGQNVYINQKNKLNNFTFVKGRLSSASGLIEYANNTTSLIPSKDSIEFTVSQAWNSGITSDFIPIEQGKYFYQASSSGARLYIYVDYYDKEKNWIRRLGSNNIVSGNSLTWELNFEDANACFIRIHHEVNATGTTTISNCMLEKANQVSTYEPYIGGNYEVNLGKNYFQSEYIQEPSTNINTVLPKGTYTISTEDGENFGKNIYLKLFKGSTLITTGGHFVSEQAQFNFSTTSYSYYGGAGWNKITFRIDDDYNLNVGLLAAGTGTRKVQIEQGTEKTPFAPYFTPIELNEIGTYQDEIFRNENLLNYKAEPTHNYTDFIIVNNGAKFIGHYQGTGYTLGGFNYRIKVEPNKQYTLKFNVTSMTADGMEFGISCNNTSVLYDDISSTGSYEATFTPTTEEIEFWGEFYLNSEAESIEITLEDLYIGRVNEYIPYGEKGNWYLHKETNKVVLKGTESWTRTQVSATNSYAFWSLFTTLGLPAPKYNINAPKICNYFPYEYKVWNQSSVNHLAENSSSNLSLLFNVDNTIATTIAEWQTWLSTHNTIVYYVLATPTNTKITDSNYPGLKAQLEALSNANTLESYTSITSSFPLSLTYVSEYEEIDEEFIKNTRASFEETYGPINSIVLSRSADSDNVYIQDEASIEENGLTELKISDNQILNGNDRDTYLQGLLDRLDGLTFNTNDFESVGITYLELCDRYRVKVRDNKYKCVMLNNEIEVNNGLNETIYTDMPQETKTDYTKADKTDRKINQTYIIADKQQGQIEALVSKTNNIDTAEKNNYQDILNKLGDYALDSKVDEIETSVRQIQTDTYLKTEVNQILKGTFYDEDNNQIVSEVVKTTSGTFDENGMLYEKTNAKTSTRINEIGVKVQDTISNDELLFAGYDDNINQTIVRADNMTTRNFLVVGQYSRFQDYQDGTGVFDL